ncbi:MAG TPA: hypothetical protein DC009_09590 [Porphyromonadaceae bacterium]|nr:hypothetical protein [Porphyromonadaceae bacterium]
MYAAASSKKNFVVVIDPGHGGKDNGETDNKAVEKEITLNVALRLQEILSKKKGYKVILTRNADKSVNLRDRAAKANKEKADLFISLHTNFADEDTPDRQQIDGTSIYVIGHDEENDDGFNVAVRENEAIFLERNYKDKYDSFVPGEDEATLTAKSKGIYENSIGFAGELLDELAKTTNRKMRGIFHDGFLVLKDANMPAVLIEMDFISNKQSALYINSSVGQKRMAQGIANAVVTYRDKLKKLGNKAYQSDAEVSSEDCYVLVSNAPSSKRSDVAPSKPQSRQTALPRKRRSASSRKASSERNLETDNITLRSESAGTTVSSNAKKQQTAAATHEEEPTPVKQKTSEKRAAQKGEAKALKRDKKMDKKDKPVAEQNTEKSSKSKHEDENNGGEVRPFGNKKVVVNRATPSNPRSLKTSKNTVDTKPAETKENKSEAKEVTKAKDSKDAKAMPAEKKQEQTPAQEVKNAFSKTKQAKEQPNKSDDHSVAKKRTVVKRDISETSKKQDKEEKKADKNDKKKSKAEADNAEDNKRQYEAAKKKSADNYNASSAPRSLKSRKNKKQQN